MNLDSKFTKKTPAQCKEKATYVRKTNKNEAHISTH